MDSAIHSNSSNIASGEVFDLGTEQVTIPEDKDGLDRFGGRKFIISIVLIIISSIFTGMLLMTIDQWLWFTGAIAGSYFGINFTQKKMLG